ncbi:MAG: hypothetical protein LBJ18_00600 [Rickettsiales bacterium]|jgi:hypothetical protein|nr:hypothetical protein [Rickettsiales bacterium]
MKIYFIIFLALLLFVHPSSAEIASKEYVDDAISTMSAGLKGEKGDDGAPGPKGDNGLSIPIYTNKLKGAATGAEFGVNVPGGYYIKMTKQSTAAYWALRIINNTGAPAVWMTKFIQYYNNSQTPTGRNATIAVGGELNPDVDTANIGYGGDGAHIVYFMDKTNMTALRITVLTELNDAIIVAEKLY